MNPGQILEDEFNRSIVEELLREEGISINDQLIEKIWVACNGNPWNAKIIYFLIQK